MAEETVTVGCRLPHGIVMEVGYSTTIAVGNGTAPQYRQTEKYRRVVIKGTHSNNRPGIQPVMLLRPEPGITEGVPKAVVDEWLKAHPVFLANGSIFVVPKGGRDSAEVRANAIELEGRKTGLEPRDPTELPKELKVIQPGRDEEE